LWPWIEWRGTRAQVTHTFNAYTYIALTGGDTPRSQQRRATPRYPTLARPAPSRSHRRSSTLTMRCALSLPPLVRHSRIPLPSPPLPTPPSLSPQIILPFHQMAAESVVVLPLLSHSLLYVCIKLLPPQSTSTRRSPSLYTTLIPSTLALSLRQGVHPPNRREIGVYVPRHIRVFVCICTRRDRDGAASDAGQGHTSRGARDGDRRERDGMSEKGDVESEREIASVAERVGTTPSPSGPQPTASH